MSGVALRPNVTCDPTNRGERQNPTRDYFNASCFSRPSVTSPFGNAGRNIARSDSYFNFDLGVQKQFRLPINEATRLEVRAEFFNLFNRTNFQADIGNISINSSGVNVGNFSTINSTFPARQIQVALKFYF